MILFFSQWNHRVFNADGMGLRRKFFDISLAIHFISIGLCSWNRNKKQFQFCLK
uniref:Uncharacterized protein n=1 Tax=viral metagenome TaxID=1070528 RepID=A0A6C0DNW4_9ZZZZ